MSLARTSRARVSERREGEEKKQMSLGLLWVPAPLSWWSSMHGRRARGYAGGSGLKAGVKSPGRYNHPGSVILVLVSSRPLKS